jgi:hypothetical protein
LESLEIPKKNNREAVEDIKEAPLSEQWSPPFFIAFFLLNWYYVFKIIEIWTYARY